MQYVTSVYAPRTDDDEGRLSVSLGDIDSAAKELFSYSPLEHTDPEDVAGICKEIAALEVGATWQYTVPADEYYYSEYSFAVIRVA